MRESISVFFVKFILGILLLTMMLALSSYSLFSQGNDCNFLMVGGSKSWKIARYEIVEDEWGNPIGSVQFNDEYLLFKDTVVDSKLSQGLYYIDKVSNNTNDTLLIGYYHCLGEEVVYSSFFNEQVPSTLSPYSFFQDGIVLNTLASIGDTIMVGVNDIGGLINIVVIDVDTVSFLDGITRRRLRVKDFQYFDDFVASELPDPLFFVEGIGNFSNGLHLHFRRQFNDWTTSRDLICYYENEDLIYLDTTYSENGCSSESLSQVDSLYVPLLSDGMMKRWYLMNFNFESDTISSILYNYGDTLIRGETFEKFYITNEEYSINGEWFESGEYVGAIREDDTRIFFEHPNNNNQNVMSPILDFSTTIGDTIYRYIDEDNVFWFGIVISKFDRSYSDNVNRTRFTSIVYSLDLNNPNAMVQEEYLENLIEGILVVQPAFSGSLFRTIFDRHTSEHVQCFFENDMNVFHSEYVFTENLPCYYNGFTSNVRYHDTLISPSSVLFPNPSNGRVNILPGGYREISSVSIVSITTGGVVKTITNEGNIFNINDLPSGCYIVSLNFIDGSLEKLKIIKQ